METYVIRLWLPDRPGALSGLAGTLGELDGDVIAIDVLEREEGRAADQLTVQFPLPVDPDELRDRLRALPGVEVEIVRLAAEDLHDPALDALLGAADLVEAVTEEELVEIVAHRAWRMTGADWAAVVRRDDRGETDPITTAGQAPPRPWLAAFTSGVACSTQVTGGGRGMRNVHGVPLPGTQLTLVLQREDAGFRSRERRQLELLGRIAGVRLSELRYSTARLLHPAVGN